MVLLFSIFKWCAHDGRGVMRITTHTDKSKTMSSFINNPSTIEDFKQNIDFQMDNVKGWLSVNDYQSALIKARMLVDALQEIVATEESERIDLQPHSA